MNRLSDVHAAVRTAVLRSSKEILGVDNAHVAQMYRSTQPCHLTPGPAVSLSPLAGAWLWHEGRARVGNLAVDTAALIYNIYSIPEAAVSTGRGPVFSCGLVYIQLFINQGPGSIQPASARSHCRINEELATVSTAGVLIRAAVVTVPVLPIMCTFGDTLPF